MKLFNTARKSDGDDNMTDLTEVVKLRQEARTAESVLGALASERSRFGLMASVEQRNQLNLARFDLYSEIDVSPEAFMGALARCAGDEKAEVSAAEADQRRLDENAAALDDAQRRLATLQGSLAQRQATRSAADARAADEESAARAAVEEAAPSGDDDAITAAQGRYQHARTLSDQRRAARESETAVIEAIERQAAAQEAAIAALHDSARRIGESRAEHLRGAEAAKWDAMVNRFIPVARAMWESGAGLLLEGDLILPFHDPRRVFAAGLVGGNALRFDGLDRLSRLKLKDALAAAEAVIERSRAEIERAREEVAERVAQNADERATEPEAHPWERAPAVTIKVAG